MENKTIVELDQDELAMRLMERAIGLKRPNNIQPASIHLKTARKEWPHGDFPFDDMAVIALIFFKESIENDKIKIQ
jgi:hypothetical protein